MAPYSDALESIINVVAAAVAAWALHVGARAADADHPYGHGEAECLSAVLIILAALSIPREADAITERIERALCADDDGMVVTIRVEPEEEDRRRSVLVL